MNRLLLLRRSLSATMRLCQRQTGKLTELINGHGRINGDIRVTVDSFSSKTVNLDRVKKNQPVEFETINDGDNGQLVAINITGVDGKRLIYKQRRSLVNNGRPASVPRDGIINDLGSKEGYLGWLNNPTGAKPK